MGFVESRAGYDPAIRIRGVSSRELDSNQPNPIYEIGALPRVLSRHSAPAPRFERGSYSLTARRTTIVLDRNASRETAARLRAVMPFLIVREQAHRCAAVPGAGIEPTFYGFRDRRPTVRRSRSAPAGSRTLSVEVRARCSANELQARKQSVSLTGFEPAPRGVKAQHAATTLQTRS